MGRQEKLIKMHKDFYRIKAIRQKVFLFGSI